MKKGFTLIELIVIITIVSILSSVVLSSYNSAKEKQEQQSKNNINLATVAYKPEQETSTDNFSCNNIPNQETRTLCGKETYNSKMIEECITRYQ